MLSLTTSFFLIEIIVGYITNSMALVADSFHMLSDVIALVIAYVSVRMSPKKWSKNTFGWARAEVLGALVNAVFLCALCFSILVESIKRFYNPELIHDAPLIMVVGLSGLLVNVIGLFLFKGKRRQQVLMQKRKLGEKKSDQNYTSLCYLLFNFLLLPLVSLITLINVCLNFIS